jgi:hypothetical protein
MKLFQIMFKNYYIKMNFHKMKQKMLLKYKYFLIISIIFIIFLIISYDIQSNEFLLNNTYRLVEIQTSRNSKCNQTITQKFVLSQLIINDF